MRAHWPVMRANAIAAGIFAFLLAVIFPFLERMPQGYHTPLMLAFTFGYILLMNRWLVRQVPPPDLLRPRRGSFKAEKGRGWRIARWVGSVVLLGIVVQIAVFAAVYVVTRAAMHWLVGV